MRREEPHSLPDPGLCFTEMISFHPHDPGKKCSGFSSRQGNSASGGLSNLPKLTLLEGGKAGTCIEI